MKNIVGSTALAETRRWFDAKAIITLCPARCTLDFEKTKYWLLSRLSSHARSSVEYRSLDVTVKKNCGVQFFATRRAQVAGRAFYQVLHRRNVSISAPAYIHTHNLYPTFALRRGDRKGTVKTGNIFQNAYT